MIGREFKNVDWVEIVVLGLVTVMVCAVFLIIASAWHRDGWERTGAVTVDGHVSVWVSHHARVVVVDGCEYLFVDEGSDRQAVAHKGNCRFCRSRPSR